jgi:Putative binding domain, N-terminal
MIDSNACASNDSASFESNRIAGRSLLLLFLLLLPFLAPGQVTETGWFDGFENYVSGAFPSPDWTFSGNSNIQVDSSVRASGNQSVRLYGDVGGCWSALLHRRINLSVPFTLEFQTRNGTEPLSGCHPLRSWMGLHTGPSWTNPSRKLISFDGDGKIRGSFGASNGFVGSVLGDYAVGQWIRVKLTYERPAAGTVRLNYWINDQFKLSETLAAFGHESQLAYLSPTAVEGTAWFDDIRITPGATVTCTYSLSSTSQSSVSTGGTGTVSVLAPGGCNWQAVSNASWITLTSAASGSGSGTVSYAVAANPGTAARSGSLTIAGQTFTVGQGGSGSGEIVTTYDLAAGWSDVINPNGVWSYNRAPAVAITNRVADWDTSNNLFGSPQAAWAAAPYPAAGHVPMWFKRVSDSTTLDFPVGRVGMHGSETSNAGVTWTSPLDGAVDISGGVWQAAKTGAHAGRSMNWRVLKNGLALTGGSVSSSDSFTSASPFVLQNGSGGAAALTHLNVSRGDVITLELFKASSFTSFVGVNLTITARSPATCSYLLSSTSQSFVAVGGSGTVNVTAAAGCNWLAQSNVSWITLASATSGSGNGTVSYAVAANPATAARTGTLTVAVQTLTVTQAAAQPGVETTSLFVPIVLSAAGLNNSFFTSELVLCNRGSSNATLEFTYAAAFGGGSGTAIDILPAGQQRIFADALAYLHSIRIPIPASGNRGGTLAIRFSGLSSPSDVSATVRTTSAVPGGRAGLAYSGIPVSGALTGPAYLCGLRQNTIDRSNVAVQNAGTAADGDIVLRLTVFSGRPEAPFSWVLPEERLAPGDFRQISEILISNGLSLNGGYIRVERVSGTAPYYAYAVINDQANSDGSFVAPIPENALAGRAGLTLPVIVETSSFSSELVLTNWSTTRKTLLFSFVADSIQAAGNSANFVMNLEPGQQSIIPKFVQFLRDQGVVGIGPRGPAYVGPLFATVQGGNADGVFLGARTAAPGGNGQYGLFYPAVPYGMSTTTSAWLYGLQQNAENRTNLALVNTGEIDGAPGVFSLDIFDGNTGLKLTTVEGITLKARGWMQIGSILAQYASTTTHAYVRITKTLGSNPFITYSVINDGAQPEQRTGDGAYIASSP